MEQANAITGCAQTISRLDVAVSLGLIARNKVRLLATSYNVWNYACSVMSMAVFK